jgi:hypothetical protein
MPSQYPAILPAPEAACRQDHAQPRPKRRAAPPPPAQSRQPASTILDLDAELAALAAMPLTALRRRWREVTGRLVPRVRSTLLHLALAWELQAALHGGLPRRSEQRLAFLAGRNEATQAPLPGARLVREWDGVLHSVEIADDGTIRWQGQSWRSLSEVARAITATRWSGPVFFGLKPRRKQGKVAA